MPPAFITKDALCQDLARLGLASGDIVLVHAAMSTLGPLLNGPDAAIGALRDCVGTEGTVMAYADWDARYEDLLNPDGTVPEEWRAHIPPYDPLASRTIRDHGVFPEFLRTKPGTVRSANPGASIVAVGKDADRLTRDHPIDYGYGPGSPFAKLVEAGGKVLMLGAPLDTMTIIHHAEHLADIPDKRIKRVEVPFLTNAGVEWRMVEEFDTGLPISPRFEEDYFGTLMDDYLALGTSRQGTVGEAKSVLVDAAPLVAFAIEWIEARAR